MHEFLWNSLSAYLISTDNIVADAGKCREDFIRFLVHVLLDLETLKG